MESDIAFARYDIEGLLRKVEQSASGYDRSRFSKYFKRSQSYIRHTLSSYFQPGVFDIKDALRNAPPKKMLPLPQPSRARATTRNSLSGLRF